MTSREFSEKTGISLRKLQWWDEIGVLKPKRRHGSGGRGKPRVYSSADIRRALRIASLSDAGIQPRNFPQYEPLPWTLARRVERPTVFKGVLYVPASYSRNQVPGVARKANG